MIEITRFSISEETAKSAKNAYSFSDYVSGSATSSYNGYVERFKNEVERLIKANPKNATSEAVALCQYYANKYSRKLADFINRDNAITARVPSVMIAGASNFPVRKKEKQNAALSKLYEENSDLFSPESCYYMKKIRTILTNDVIYSDDDCVIEKLQDKLTDLKEKHSERVKQNAYFRKNKTMVGYEGLSEEQAKRIDQKIAEDFAWNNQPHPTWKLQNENAEIKRIEKRIADITKIKAEAATPAADKYENVDGVEVVENAEAMRIQLIFDGKPDEETRSLLKSHGFRWSPKFSAWQRQLNGNGKFAVQTVLKKLKELRGNV